MNARLDALDAARDHEERRALVADAMEAFEAAFITASATEMPFADVVRAIAQENLLVRRDDLGDILDAKARGIAIPIAEPDAPTSGNAAAFGPHGEGLRIAMTEGHARPSFLSAIIAFAPTGLDVRHAPDTEEMGIHRPDRTYVRSVRGDLPPTHIRYLILRIPRHLFPGTPNATDGLVEPEADDAPGYVLRGYRFQQQGAWEQAA
ncbi:hypothetical protein HY480_04320 [Candidatus Uhrbacteria bacterium]|nr:hypothetical protein [Candidatus Uhrbacteria bacterium]